MKKYFYFLAIAVLFAACQNKQNEELGAPFQKGQKVTLSATIANPDGSAKQMPGKQRVSGLDDTPSDPTNGAIKLTWNEGDEIKVTVNGQSATFTLKEGYGGSSTGEFEGFMPAEGTTYTVDYPVTAPNLANQKYVANGFGDELMSMHAENGDLNGFTLEAQNALLGLRLTGSKALSDIVVTNKQGGTYTLNCAGVTLKDEATLFYIVVPAGTWANGFKVEVLQDDKSLIADFEKTSSATFTANQVMVMPTKVADYDLKILTFEEEDSQFGEYTLSIDGDWSGGSPYYIYTWNDLIPQDMQGYGAPMIYGGDENWEFYFEDWNDDPTAYTYFWYDQNNTELAYTILGGNYMYGGIAVSNYVSEDYESCGTYDYQLTAYATGGNSGTNFGVLNLSWDTSEEPVQPIFFADGQEHVIDHMYINLSTYMYAEALGLGYDPSAELAEDDTYTVVVTGYNSNDEETGSANIDLYKEGTFINGWTKLDLSSLGKVANIKFHVECDKNTIRHFVIDDIAVRFPKE